MLFGPAWVGRAFYMVLSVADHVDPPSIFIIYFLRFHLEKGTMNILLNQHVMM